MYFHTAYSRMSTNKGKKHLSDVALATKQTATKKNSDFGKSHLSPVLNIDD